MGHADGSVLKCRLELAFTLAQRLLSLLSFSNIPENAQYTTRIAFIIFKRCFNSLDEDFLSILNIFLIYIFCLIRLHYSFIICSVFFSQIPGMEIIICLSNN